MKIKLMEYAVIFVYCTVTEYGDDYLKHFDNETVCTEKNAEAVIRHMNGYPVTVCNVSKMTDDELNRILKCARTQNMHVYVIKLIPNSNNLLNHSDSFEYSQSLCNENPYFARAEKIFVLNSDEEISHVEIVFEPAPWNLKNILGPFDVIGDIHGCCDEVEIMLEKLGYQRNDQGRWNNDYGRKAIFVGDLTDRGPRNIDTVSLVMRMVKDGAALCVRGNHDDKLYRYLNDHNVTVSHGLESTIEELRNTDPVFREEMKEFLKELPYHLILDDGKLAVSHAGIVEKMIGRDSSRVRSFCLNGDVDDRTDENGFPVRKEWYREYHGNRVIVYGHTPLQDVLSVNYTFCIDTGCVFGNKLTALRYPEMQIIQVNALKQYYAPLNLVLK